MVSLVVHHPRFLTGRNRCRVKIMLSGRSWDEWGLMDVTPSRPLQADNWPRQAWGSLSTWPRQSRWWQLSRSLAISEEKLSVAMLCLGKFGEWFFLWRVKMNAAVLEAPQHYLSIHMMKLFTGEHFLFFLEMKNHLFDEDTWLQPLSSLWWLRGRQSVWQVVNTQQSSWKSLEPPSWSSSEIREFRVGVVIGKESSLLHCIIWRVLQAPCVPTLCPTRLTRYFLFLPLGLWPFGLRHHNFRSPRLYNEARLGAYGVHVCVI